MEVSYDIVSPFNGRIAEIFYVIGDRVQEGEVIFSLMVDDVPMQILSPVSGLIGRMEVNIGEHVIAGMIMGTVIEKTT